MSTRNKLAIKSVTNLNGMIISESTPTKEEYKKYTRTKKDELSYFIHNNYLFIKGSTTLKVISITAIFENPLDLASINACDPNGIQLDVCIYDPTKEDFPIDEDLSDDVENMALEKLVKTMMKMPEDNENNAKNNQAINDVE